MSAAPAHAAAEMDGSRGAGKTPSSRRRGRRRGVAVRPGAVKQARLEAGLSLGQVALDDISRTAIYFVETGKAKPSIETLQLIATRTRKPMDYFLEDASALSDDAALVDLERLVATGDNAGAIEAGEALVARARPANAAAQANLFLAMAYVRTARPVTARARAAAARSGFELAGDAASAAEAMSWEAAGAMMVQDAAALMLAEEALLRCRSLKPVPQPTEARILYILGTVLGSRHEHAKAIQAYEQAVALAGEFRDLRQLSHIYGNLSLAYRETGRLTEAAQYAHRAMALYETLHDNISIALAENNLALLVLEQGDANAALTHALQAERQYVALGIDAGRAHVLLTLAEVEVARADLDSAARYANAALEAADRAGEPANAGEAHTWLGRVAAARGDHMRTDAEFARAFALFDSVGARDWNARGHAEYAELLERRGDLGGANRHLRLALSAAGTPVRAADEIRTAIA